MIKKLQIIAVAIFATGTMNAQLPTGTITFDEETPEWEIKFQHGGEKAEAMLVDYTAYSPAASSANAIEWHITAAGAPDYAFPIVDPVGASLTSMNSINGKSFRFDILTPHATGTVTLGLKIDGNFYQTASTSYTGGSMSTWSSIEVNCYGYPDGVVSRMYFIFDTLDINDKFYIDNIEQFVDPTASVSGEVLHSGTKVYPNPTKGNLNISDLHGAKTVIVSNVLGQYVKSLNASDTLDISDLTPGVYFVETDNGLKRKIIKE